MQSWSAFYVVSGTAAAAMAGLVFVAVTTRPRVLVGGKRRDLTLLARQSLGSLGAVLLVSLLALVPQDLRVFGVETAISGVFLLVAAIRRLQVLHKQLQGTRGLFADLLLVTGTFGITVAGIGLMIEAPFVPYLLGLAVMTTLLTTLWSLWEFILGS